MLATLGQSWKDVLESILAIVMMLTIVVDLVCRFAEKAAALHTISVRCSELDNEWHRLWADCQEGTLQREELRRRNSELLQELTTATSEAGKANIADNKRLNQKSWETACHVEKLRYAT